MKNKPSPITPQRKIMTYDLHFMRFRPPLLLPGVPLPTSSGLYCGACHPPASRVRSPPPSHYCPSLSDSRRDSNYLGIGNATRTSFWAWDTPAASSDLEYDIDSASWPGLVIAITSMDQLFGGLQRGQSELTAHVSRWNKQTRAVFNACVLRIYARDSY